MSWVDLPTVCKSGNTLEINGRTYPPYAYMSYFGKREHYRQIADSGIHIYSIPAFIGDQGINSLSGIGPMRKGIWRGESIFDISELSDEINLVLDIDPDAYFFIRLNVDPPAWWENKYPEGCMQLADGSRLRQSFASPVWRTHTEDALRNILRKIFREEYACRIVCLHVAGSQTEEWMSRYRPDVGFQDLNPHRTSAFRQWISKEYSNDAGRLRKAWNCNYLDFETIEPADMSCKDYPVELPTPLVDTLRFQSHITADTIEYLCKIVKDESHDRLFTGAFYGYSCYISDPRLSHYALSKMVESPYLDIMTSPNMYNRVPGEDWPPMAAIDSVKLHGKLWFAENDTRTFCKVLLADVAPEICPDGMYADSVWIGPESPDICVNLLWKNAGRMLANGYGGWWFDLWGGWYKDQRLLDVFKSLQNLYLQYPEIDPVWMHPEVCVLVNEELCYYDQSHGAITAKIIENIQDLAKAGAPYRIILAKDAELLPESSFAFVWMLGTDGNREAMLEEAKRLLKPSGITLESSFSGSILHRDRMESSQECPWPLRIGADRIRNLYKDAGVHVYIDSEDVLYAGNGWVVIHAVEAGDKELRLPAKTSVTDVISGLTYKYTDRISMSMLQYQTVILRME